MTDFGRRVGVGDMLAADYDPVITALVALSAAHKTQHQIGGADALSLAGLTPGLHKLTHKLGGTDPIDCTGLPGTGGAGLLWDGTPGRVLRFSTLYLKDGTEAAKLKCQLINQGNGDAIAETDNIAKGTTEGSFTWSADGTKLTIECAGLSGNVRACAGIATKNALALETRSHINCLAVVEANDINVKLYEQGTGNLLDIGVLIDYGDVWCTIIYVTDA